MTASRARMFAVAVTDGPDLFLWLRLRRNRKGEIFYVFPTQPGSSQWSDGNWDPHGSKHIDGKIHSKSHGVKSMVRALQIPDDKFKGVENFVTRPIAADDPRGFGVLCKPDEFDEVFKLPISDLGPTKYTTLTSVDLTEAGHPAIITPGGTILKQHRFTDALPEILVTLFRNPSHCLAD